MSERREFIIDMAWYVVFIVAGFATVATLLVFAPKGHDPVLTTPVVSASMPPCPHNAVIVGHNQYPKCDLTSHGLLIELGTTRGECLDQGGRFVMLNDRRVCMDEDF